MKPTKLTIRKREKSPSKIINTIFFFTFCPISGNQDCLRPSGMQPRMKQSTNPSLRFPDVGFVTCMRMCERLTKCGFINFDFEKFLCVLNSFEQVASSQEMSNMDSFYDKTKFPKSFRSFPSPPIRHNHPEECFFTINKGVVCLPYISRTPTSLGPTQIPDQRKGCPFNMIFDPRLNLCYSFHAKPKMSHREAGRSCKRNGRGWLIVMDSNDKVLAVRNKMKELKPSDLPNFALWIAGVYNISTHTFRTSRGTITIPNITVDHDVNQCAAMPLFDNSLRTFECSHRHGFICELTLK